MAAVNAPTSLMINKPQEECGGGSHLTSERTRKRLIKTEFCKFFPKCMKGEDCLFAHSEAELEKRPDLTKTSLCPDWRRGRCTKSAAECKFAHGPWDLRGATQCAPVRAPLSEQTTTQKASRSLQKLCGTSGGMSRQVSSETATTTDEDFGDDISPGGVSRQVSSMTWDILSDGAWSRQASMESDELEQMEEDQASECGSLADGDDGLYRQHRTPAPVGSPAEAAEHFQMPLLIDVGQTKAATMVTINYLSPEALVQLKATLEKQMLEAMPLYYED